MSESSDMSFQILRLEGDIARLVAKDHPYETPIVFLIIPMMVLDGEPKMLVDGYGLMVFNPDETDVHLIGLLHEMEDLVGKHISWEGMSEFREEYLTADGILNPMLFVPERQKYWLSISGDGSGELAPEDLVEAE